MIIHQPEIIHKDGYAILWSKFELDTKPLHFPDHIWYRVPEYYLPFLHTQSDAFLVAGLLAGMYFGEDIQVRGKISPRLAYHLDEYQYLIHFRMPKDVKRISIRYEQLTPLDACPTKVGTTFSGGVDSLYTIQTHLPINQPIPDYQITHGIFIQGFDILPSEISNYRQLFNVFKEQASHMGIELIQLETNMVSLLHQRLNLSYFYGPLIVSAGLVFSGLFHRFYTPSSWDYHALLKHAYASDPLVDRLLSTDTMDIIHHDSTCSRIEKVSRLAGWEPAQNLMWVCFEHKNRNYPWNCSRCEKCVRTMIPLYALGVLNTYKTFAQPIRKNWELLRYARKFDLRSDYLSEMFSFIRSNKPSLLPWLFLATILGLTRYLVIKYLPQFIKTKLRRYGFFVDRNQTSDAYEVPEITQLIRNTYDHPSA